jgi:hypothetical protein
MNFIKNLERAQKEKAFDIIESTIQKSVKNVKPYDIFFTKNDLIKRAEFSNEQIKNGHTINQKELEQQAKNW